MKNHISRENIIMFGIPLAAALCSIVAAIIYHDLFLAAGGILIALGLMILIFFILSLRRTEDDSRKKSGLILLLGALVILGVGGGIINSSYHAIREKTANQRYTKSLGADVETILSMTGHSGEKYVVYDSETKNFVAGILSPELRADKAEDIGGIFIMDTDDVEVFKYQNGDIGAVYELTVSFYDTYSGEILRSGTIYGGMPPESIPSKSGKFYTTTWHGSMPDNEEIAELCLALISE